MIKQSVIIVNKLGLHARAAAKFAALASRYRSEIKVERAEMTVNGKSIMGLMMLAASKGTSINIMVTGEDEIEALADLVNLINQRFDEAE